MFKKILIANRGEIACRIMRTAKKMGIETIAVYSEADQEALFVKQADQAYLLGGPLASDSYLNIEKIISIAKQAKACAIHPGYGFLSENAEFATRCQEVGIVFIGPSPDAISAMGSKSIAKSIMAKAKLPLIPGYHGEKQESAYLQKQAVAIGFPVLIKAACGGGGKGMRIVQQESDFAAALASCQREAKSSFGDESVLLEKYIGSPHHIEVQVFADNHGNVVHIFERDCSIQRRHQKIIEEAKAPDLSESLRSKIYNAAITATKAIQYSGAGTIEFLVDEKQEFYFMEMNTRLQVEHPVTEMISGLDLVEWQIRVADGETLPKQQSEITAHGHALEVRIYAEDPNHQFAPSIGKISYLQEPKLSKHVRIDTGITEQDTISPYYDPMIAKLIVWDEDRTQATQKLQQALAEFHIVGVKTNIHYLQNIIGHADFQAGKFNTHFIESNQTDLIGAQQEPAPFTFALAALFLVLKNQEKQRHNQEEFNSPWHAADGFQINLPWQQKLAFVSHENLIEASIIIQESTYQIRVQEHEFFIDSAHLQANNLLLHTQQQAITITIVQEKLQLHLFYQGIHEIIHLPDIAQLTHTQADIKGHFTAPMPGTVISVHVQTGEQVEAGSPLLILEAMKMEHTITAPFAGKVLLLKYQVGDLVNEGAELLVLEPLDTQA